jgi:hypothetical protein
MENNDIEQQLVVENTTKLINDTYTNTRYTYIFLCKICLFSSIFVFLILYFVLR